LKIVSNDPLPNLRSRAADALAPHADRADALALVETLGRQSPAVRRSIIEALTVRPAAAAVLLDAIADGRIARIEVGQARESALLKHRDAAIRGRAEDVFKPSVPADRQTVLADYRQALDLKGDPLAGRELFRRHCAACHKISDLGINVAPDISDSRVKRPEQLLVDILNPNQAIDNNYASYTLVTTDGAVHVGIVAAETAASVTLRQAENKTVDVLRADIDTLKSNGVSLMPEGFEKQLSHQQLADVIAFVKNWRYLDRPIPQAAGAATGK